MSHEYFFNVPFWSCGHWLSWPKPNSRKGVSKLLHGTKNPVNLHVFYEELLRAINVRESDFSEFFKIFCYNFNFSKSI